MLITCVEENFEDNSQVFIDQESMDISTLPLISSPENSTYLFVLGT